MLSSEGNVTFWFPPQTLGLGVGWGGRWGGSEEAGGPRRGGGIIGVGQGWRAALQPLPTEASGPEWGRQEEAGL